MSDAPLDVRGLLGPEGPIARRLPDFEVRPQQLDLSLEELDLLDVIVPEPRGPACEALRQRFAELQAGVATLRSAVDTILAS